MTGAGNSSVNEYEEVKGVAEKLNDKFFPPVPGPINSDGIYDDNGFGVFVEKGSQEESVAHHEDVDREREMFMESFMGQGDIRPVLPARYFRYAGAEQGWHEIKAEPGCVIWNPESIYTVVQDEAEGFILHAPKIGFIDRDMPAFREMYQALLCCSCYCNNPSDNVAYQRGLNQRPEGTPKREIELRYDAGEPPPPGYKSWGDYWKTY